MRKGAKAAFVAGLIVIVILALTWDRAPRYGGKSFYYWVDQLEPRSAFRNSDPAVIALRQIGTNAGPILLDWISSADPPRWRIMARTLAHQWIKRISAATLPRNERAELAFFLIDGAAASLAPELARLALTLHDPKRSDRCIRALGYIGPEAVPGFRMLLQNGGQQVKTTVIAQLPRLGTNAITLLELAASDPDPLISSTASNTLLTITAAARARKPYGSGLY